MNSILVLCVGMMGAVNPALETQNHQPVQTAENRGIAAGGCYGQYGQPATYRSPVAQNGSLGYSNGAANCPGGICPTGSAANRANVWGAPVGNASYSARPLTPVSYSSGNANCPNGQCPIPRGYSPNPANGYGPNYPQQVPSGYYPPTYDTRYNSVPTTRFPARGYSQPRNNAYPATRPVDANWPSNYRTMPVSNYRSTPTSNYQGSDSPFFN